MKNIYFLIVILVLVGVGYMAFNKKEPTSEVPTTTGKLDINAVCDGALAYMTFPDGASADKFLAECKAGERPEVIEKYLQDMGLDDGRAI